MRNQLHSLARRPSGTTNSQQVRLLRFAGWNFALRQLGTLRSFISPNQQSQRAKKGLIAAGLLYTALLVVGALAAPKALNFDWFFLCGCALIGWAVGARAALGIVLASAGFLFCRDAFLGPPARPTWIIYWNSIIRLLAFGSISWLAGEAGRLTRNLEQSVHERTGRLQSEVSQHRQTTELLSEAIELFR